jgi:hypothetical protein
MLRKYGTGQVTGVEPTTEADKIEKTAAQDWQDADEQALQVESES